MVKAESILSALPQTRWHMPVPVAFTLSPSWKQKKILWDPLDQSSRSKRVIQVKFFFWSLFFHSEQCFCRADTTLGITKKLLHTCCGLVLQVWLEMWMNSFGNPLRPAALGKGVLWGSEGDQRLRFYCDCWCLFHWLFPLCAAVKYHQARLLSSLHPCLPVYILTEVNKNNLDKLIREGTTSACHKWLTAAGCALFIAFWHEFDTYLHLLLSDVVSKSGLLLLKCREVTSQGRVSLYLNFT